MSESSSNGTAAITLMGSTSTLVLTGDTSSPVTESSQNSTTLTSSTADNAGGLASETSLVSPSYSHLSDSGSSLLSSITSISSNSSRNSSSSAFHTHGEGSSVSSSRSSSSSLSTPLSSPAYQNVSSSLIESSEALSESSLQLTSDLSSEAGYSASSYSTPVSSSGLVASTTMTFSADATTAEYTSYGYPEPTSEDSITIVYTQTYCITDDSTTLVTELPTTTTADADSSYTSEPHTITTDISFLQNSVHGFTHSDNSSDGSSSGAKTIAGSVVGAVAAVSILLIVIWFWIRRRKRESHSFEKGFSHSIASTRRYDGINASKEKTLMPSPRAGFSFVSLVPSIFKTKSSRSSNNSFDSTGSTEFGLGSLRTSILQDQPYSSERIPIQPTEQSYTRQPPPRPSHPTPQQLRTIDTVFEDSETSSATASPVAYSKSRQQSYKTARYQNIGLKSMPISSNPFDDGLGRRAPPPPPPPPPPPSTRRANAYPAAVDFHRHGVNRHSVASVESSILSDDTEDISSDESLVLGGENHGSSAGNTGFFREIV